MECSTCLLFGALLYLFLEQSNSCIRRRDARLLPDITRVPNPYESTPSITTPQAELAIDNVKDATEETLSEEWRSTFLRRFKGFREARVQLLSKALTDRSL